VLQNKQFYNLNTMKIHRITIILAIIMIFGPSLLAGPPEPVMEKSPSPAAAGENPWSFRAAFYGWMQSLNGTVGVRGIESDVDIRFSDILQDLNIGAMGVLELRYRRWAVMADMVYADLRGSADTPFNFFFTKVDYEQKQFLGNFVLSYLLVDDSRFKLDVYAGARVNYLESEITLIGNRLPLPPGFPTFIVPNRGFGGSKAWVDPIIGGRFQANIAGPCFVRVGGDIGGFGVSSEFTWQAYGVLGVNVTRNMSIGAGYRALGTDYSSGGFKYDLIASGPVIGSEIRF
jgi:hypothetical protein